jgi:hypothetical protein
MKSVLPLKEALSSVFRRRRGYTMFVYKEDIYKLEITNKTKRGSFSQYHYRLEFEDDLGTVWAKRFTFTSKKPITLYFIKKFINDIRTEMLLNS